MQFDTTPQPHPDDTFTEFPWPSDAEPAEVAPGVYLPTRLIAAFPPFGPELTVEELEEFPGLRDFSYIGWFELSDYQFVMRRLVVEDRGADGVTSQMLRGFTMRDMMQIPMQSAARTRGDDGRLFLYQMHDLRRAAQEGPTDENLKTAARVYAVGHAMQIKPTAAVEDALGLKRSTAENWVRRAKDKGYVFAEA